MDTVVWILNAAFLLAITFGGFAAKRIIHELDHSRTKIAELYSMNSDLRVKFAEAEARTGKEYLTKADFAEFKTEIINRFEKTDDKLDLIMSELRNGNRNERERR